MEILERIWELVTGFFTGISSKFERAVTSMFGSSNARFVKKLQPKLQQINALEAKYKALSDEELRNQTFEFRRRLEAGETLDDILVEAFAVCREGGVRFLGMRHYDVQMIGGMVLHSGNIAEMVTGEGKTLVATLPAYLNAIAGSVHVVTVNDYLARRDMEWMAPLYMGLGLTVGNIYSGMEPDARQRAYACDITYGTNNEFGFDYLRDNMRPAASGDPRYPTHMQQVQGKLIYAIIDEVDNILIDEARTPLIIAGPAHDDLTKYGKADKIARQLNKELHFEVKEKEHTVNLTDEGVRAAEKLAGVESFYTAGNMEWPHLIDNSLKAHYLYKRDVNYVVQEGEVVIVDEFTGRLMPGRNWSDGLHQAVEAKENVRIKEETQTLATITLQNFFKLYGKICGMTGTGMTEAGEFWKIYKLDVIAIPTNRGLQRINFPDTIYTTEQSKFKAIAAEIEQLNKWDTLRLTDDQLLTGTIKSETETEFEFLAKESKQPEKIAKSKVRHAQRKGRPILVGTVSIEKSERLSHLLTQRGIKHEVLNAKHHKREAEIVAQAGRFGAVTIATNMAGRGTDIILGGNPDTMAWALLQDKYATRLDVPKEEWDELVHSIEEREQMKASGQEIKTIGGLHIIGTERHEARRIDLQLRGRCGRQGDPGSSRFFLSLEDDLMRIFAGEWVKNVLTRLGMTEDEAIESKMVSRRIEGAQRKVEERNFEIRKNLLEYDEVMDEQRKRVYSYRQQILDGVNCKDLILEMIDNQIDQYLGEFLSHSYGNETFAKWSSGLLSVELNPNDFRGMDFEAAERFAKDEAERKAEGQIFDAIEENLPAEEDKSEWNWEALANWSNVRWKTNLRANELRKIGRDDLAEAMIQKAQESIQAVDLSEGAKFLDENFGVITACGWVQHKFGLTLDPKDYEQTEPEAFKKIIREKAVEIYDQKETEYPVLTGIMRFSAQDAQGNRRYEREPLIRWGIDRFDIATDFDELNKLGLDELQQLFLEFSYRKQQLANQLHEEVQQRFDSVLNGRSSNTAELAQWLQEKLGVNVTADELSALSTEELQQRTFWEIEDHFRPEIRRMERSLVLQLLDMAWKDHLLAMDHLRNSVGLRGYAQVDAKVEYKREGMRTFEQMWTSVGERVTDLVFRMENLSEDFVGSTWVGAQAKHESVSSSVSSLVEQQEATDNSGASPDEKVEPIRNRLDHVGRNDPCPCGSGKKFKNCHMRQGGLPSGS